MAGSLQLPHTFQRRVTYKKPYRKSTTGCTTCKSRKIKCDEARPVCGNCRRRFTDNSCQYIQLAKQKGPLFLEQDSSLIDVKPLTLDSTNFLALRLLHHYTQATRLSQTLDCAVKHAMARTIWEDDIPRVAFTSEIVMTALLGISAWHLWALNSDDQTLAIASRSYFGKAIGLQRMALQQQEVIDDERNAESIFVAGFILAHHNWLLTQTGKHVDSFDPSLETFYMCTGHRSLAAKNLSPWCKYTTLGEAHIGRRRDSEKRSQLSLRHNKFMYRAEQDCNSLLQYIRDAGTIDLEQKETYKEVIDEIWWIYWLICDEHDDISVIEYLIVTFLHRVPTRFILLMEQKDPIAIALLARPIASLRLLGDTSSWWIHGTDQFRVDHFTVSGIKHILSPEWYWIMDWPLSIVFDEVKL
ncbi:hypothetical protein BGW36DRAFT_392102, partial [Talaromyces proteolyticus]